MDRIEGTIKIPGISKFKSMTYNSDELDTKIKKLESEKKHIQNLVRLKQSRINVYIGEYERLLKAEGKIKC